MTDIFARGSMKKEAARLRRLEKRVLHANPGARSQEAQMRSWSVAASRADTTPANVVFLGDSTTAGGSSTTRLGSYQRLIAAEFGRFWDYSPGQGYVNFTATQPGGWTPKIVDSLGSVAADNRSGLSYGSVTAASGTRLDIWAPIAAGVTTFYGMDPASAGTLNFYNGNFGPIGTTTTGAIAGGRAYTFPFPANESRFNIRVTGGTASVEGVMLYDGDYSRGVRVWDATVNGSDASVFAADSGVGLNWADGFDTIDPDLLVYSPGAAECIASTNPATFITNLTTVITNARAKAPLGDLLSVLLVIPYEVHTLLKSKAYREAVYQVARQQNCAVFDFAEVFGSMLTDSFTESTDTLHLNDAAMTRQAGAMADFLLSFAPARTYSRPATPQTGLGNLPTGALGSSIPGRVYTAANLAVLSSSRLTLVGVDLKKGVPISNVSFHSATTAGATLTHTWFCIVDKGLVMKRATVDDTSASWAANTRKTIALSSEYTPAYDGLHYIGIVVTGTTVPTLSGFTGLVSQNTVPPILTGTSTTGLSTGPKVDPDLNWMAETAITPSASVPYCDVS